MAKRLVRFAFVTAVILMAELAAARQDCATVTIQESTASNTNVLAQVSVANCRQDVGQSFENASVTVQSDSPVARVPAQNPAPMVGVTGAVNIFALPVNACCQCM